MRLDFPGKASQAFDKLLTVVPNDMFVIYQNVNLKKKYNELNLATKWFNVLSTHVPTYPRILSHMGHIFSKHDDDSQGFHYQLESFQIWPVALGVISWLGIWFLSNEMNEISIPLFELVVPIQTNEVIW